MEPKTVLERGEYSCVVARGGVIVDARRGIGVKPILSIYDRHPEDLMGAPVADRVIGKAAAMLLVLGGAAEIYGAVMSESAIEFLSARGVPHRFGERVPRIENRTRDGICPIEQSVLGTDDLEKGLKSIRGTIQKLMRR